MEQTHVTLQTGMRDRTVGMSLSASGLCDSKPPSWYVSEAKGTGACAPPLLGQFWGAGVRRDRKVLKSPGHEAGS